MHKGKEHSHHKHPEKKEMAKKHESEGAKHAHHAKKHHKGSMTAQKAKMARG